MHRNDRCCLAVMLWTPQQAAPCTLVRGCGTSSLASGGVALPVRGLIDDAAAALVDPQLVWLAGLHMLHASC